METNQTTHQTGGQQPPATRRQYEVSACYVDSPPLEDVLQEQLHYLIAHASETCAPGCLTCHRLSRVLGPLLEPFRA